MESDQYSVINFTQNTELLNELKVVVKHCWICVFVFPIMSLIVYIPMTYLMIFKVNIGVPWYALLIFTCIFTAIVVYVFWHAINNRRFIIAADESGFYYRSIEDKSIYIFIRWEWILDIKKYDIDGRELHICTSIVSDKFLPQPCNGSCYIFDDKLRFEFYPGINYTNTRLLLELSGLRDKSRN